MLARVLLEPEAIRLAGMDVRLQCRLHRDFVRVWRHHLVCLTSEELAAVVKELPQQPRKIWIEALKKLRRRKLGHVPGEPPEMLQVGIEHGAALLLCQDETLAILRRHGNGERGIELERYDCAPESRVIRECRRLASRVIEKDTPQETVMRRWFRPLLNETRELQLCDRYAFGQWQRHGRRTGLASLLGAIREAGCRRVTVLSALPAEQADGDRRRQLQRDLQALLELLAGGEPAVERADVYLVPDVTFKQLAHDRYLRCDRTTLVLGTGIDVLRPGKVPAACSINLLDHDQDYRRIAGALATEWRARGVLVNGEVRDVEWQGH